MCAMCNLYSVTKGQQAIREAFGAMVDHAGNLPAMPGVFPDYPAPIVRNRTGDRELAMARWGMPSHSFALQGKRTDPGVTNIRNVKSPHWRRWFGPENRCLVPFTSFSENEVLPDGRRPPIWFALAEDRPLAYFAGIWVPGWTSVRKAQHQRVTHGLSGVRQECRRRSDGPRSAARRGRPQPGPDSGPVAPRGSNQRDQFCVSSFSNIRSLAA